MNQKNFLAQAFYFIQNQKRHRLWLRIVTSMAAVVVFVTTYLLILPAITMENSAIEVTPHSTAAAPGEMIDTEIYAKAENGRSETTFFLRADGENAGLDESVFDFDSDGIAVFEDGEGRDIELHREYTGNGVVCYWFTLEQGRSAYFSFAWMNGTDSYRTEKVEEEAEEDASGNPGSGHSSAATGSNAMKAQSGKPASRAGQKRSLADGFSITATDSDAYPDRTEVVLDQKGDIEQEGTLTLSFGSGRNKKDAKRHTDDSITLTWAEELPFEIPEDADSWATVEKDGFRATDSNAAMLLSTAFEAVTTAEEGSYDFTEDIDKVTVSKQENGEWVSGDVFTDGDNVRVEIEYSLKENTVTVERNKISYQLPYGIALDKEEAGPVYDHDTPVGKYTISKDGLIEIVFDDSFAEDGRAFKGTILFQGTAHASEDGTLNEIDFGAAGKITVNPSPKPTDVHVKKEGSYKKEDGKLHYTLTVSTIKGTGGEITVNDAFQNSGNTLAHYDKESFQIVRVGKDGTETPVEEFSPVISKKEWEGAPEEFTIEGLPKLEAGESYRITYTATPEKSSSTTGESIVNNGVNVTSGGGDRGDSWCNVTVSNRMLTKEGKYNTSTGMIEWTVKINPDHRDISGWRLTDTITTEDGVTVTMPETVTLTGENGETQEVELPYTFPANSTDSYTITYQTKVEGLKPGETATVSNNATIGGDGEHYEGGTSVTPSVTDYGVEKGYGWHDPSQDNQETGTYQWNSSIKVPSTFDGTELEKITYTDTLHDLVEEDGKEIAGSHYITGDQLVDIKVIVNGGKLVRDLHFIICTSDGTPITDFDSETTYDDFQIRFTEEAVEELRGQTITIQYYTTVHYDWLKAGNTYMIRNTGAIPGHESTAETPYKKPGKLEKQASATGTQGSFTGDGVEVDYTASGGVIHYRLIIRTDARTAGDIILTDTLPAETKLVKDSVKLRFYYREYDERDSISWYDNGPHTYTCAENLSVSEENGVVTFTIKDGYNGDVHHTTQGKQPNTLVLYYDLSIKDDPIWTENPGLEMHVYENKVTWGSEESGTDVTVNRDVPELAKTGAQLPQYDEKGDPMTDDDGNILLSDTVRYYVTINQGGKDLDPVRDVLELKDALSLPGNAADAELNVGSVHLYRYDGKAEDNCGQELSAARYSYVYDQASRTLTFTVPDSMAMVLVYEYTIDRGTAAGEIQISNKAELTGVAGGSTENDIKFKEVSSSATVTKRSLTIYKVDGDNFGKSLPGAGFQLDYFDGAGWMSAGSDLETDDTGTIVLNLTGDDGEEVYKTDTLYRLTETMAPSGYTEDKTPHYFVWIGEGKTEDACKQSLASALQSAQVQEKDVLFISNASAVYVPNTSTTLTVKKVWIDPDGGELAPPGVDNIEVKLWKQPVETNAVTVTFNNQLGMRITSIDVASGSSLTVNVSVWGQIQYAVNEGEKQTVDHLNGTASFVLNKITSDTRVDIDGYFTEDNFAFDGYTRPSYVPAGERVLYETVHLDAKRGWSHTWNKLPREENGKRLHYTVEESAVSGFHVIYSPNNQNGIQTGDLVITNQSNGYVLPETGGTGKIPFTAGGPALLAMAGLMYITLRRREDKAAR